MISCWRKKFLGGGSYRLKSKGRGCAVGRRVELEVEEFKLG